MEVESEAGPRTRIRVSVRDLVAFLYRGGDLHAHQFGSLTTLEGIRGHQTLQKSRGEGYTPEVTVRYTHESEDFVLEVAGRMDGLFAEAEPPVVEEIKTTRRPFDEILPEAERLHMAQCKAYAALYYRSDPPETVVLQLTYYHVESTHTHCIRERCDGPGLSSFLKELVEAYLDYAKRQAVWIEARNRSIAALPFPYPAYRSGQRSFAVSVYRAIRDGQRLFAQAPTGIGKTMAALYPSIKALGEGQVQKIFYLTAKTSGAQLALKALAHLREAGLRIKSVQITAKDKCCFNAPCQVDRCAYALGYYDRWRPAHTVLFAEEVFHRPELLEQGARWTLCPFELSLDLALDAEVIICDYNYAFDPGAYLRRFFGEQGSGHILLIDEAHNLVDRSRDMYSAALDQREIQGLAQLLKETVPSMPELVKAVNRLNRACSKQLKLLSEVVVPVEPEPGKPFVPVQAESVSPLPPQALLASLAHFCQVYECWQAEQVDVQAPEPLRHFYFQAKRFQRCAEFFDSHFATLYRWFGRKLETRIQNLSAAHLLEVLLATVQSTVFFSATLSPFPYYRSLLGTQEDAPTLALSSPFPKEQLCVLVAKGVSTRYQHRERTREEVARLIETVVGQRAGHYLVFFPSYRYLQDTFEKMKVPADWAVLIQAPGMEEHERETFLARFEGSTAETLVGFAVMGGSFGEGIDLVGEALIGVIVVGVGLPMVCTERELMKAHFSEMGLDGFAYAYQYPGMNRVLQTAGRVIRSETDRGVVCLIDERFAEGRYRQLFPAHWSPLYVRTAAEAGVVLSDFWKGLPQKG